MDTGALNIISFAAHLFKGTPAGGFLTRWEDPIYSFFVAAAIAAVFFFASRRLKVIPGRFQALLELLIGGADEFVEGMLGKQGRKYLPFVGTLFIYIIVSNLLGFIPFLKSPTASLNMTFGLSICVFLYVQYTAFSSMGVKKYVDHLMGSPRGAMAFTVLMPLFLFFMHLVSEFVRPFSLALRLRSNIFGDDLMMATLSGFGFAWIPLLFFSMLLSLIAAVVQALVFSLLSTVYFALALPGDEVNEKK